MCVDTANDMKRVRIIYKKIPHLNNRKISWKKIIKKYYEKKTSR